MSKILDTKRITEEVLNSKVVCSACGKISFAKDMKFIGIQLDSTDKVDFELALFNCSCRSTQSIRIPKVKGE